MKDITIVGLGGTTRAGSSSETAIRLVLRRAEALGAKTRIFAGPDLVLPIFAAETPERTPAARDMIEALRTADAIVLSSPGYHGTISGLVKNALDYTEDMRGDERVYFEGRAVGCIVCAGGWQATGPTLAALRSIVHALRGWPTPLGIGINTAEPVFSDGECTSPSVAAQLDLMAEQLVTFARAMAADTLRVA
jgi:FMN reductase